MKRLFYIIVIVGIPVIVFFQYQNWTKFSAPNEYDYSLSDEIDTEYYDQEAVKTYYENVQEIGSYARAMWHTYDLDVKNYDQNDPVSKERALYYEFLIAQTRLLEQKLKNSKRYKSQGFSNHDIKLILDRGISAETYKKELDLQNYTGVKFGDLSQEVYDIQKRLRELGYELPIDGNFKNSTQETLKDFQKKNDLAPTGYVDKKTARKLWSN
ncbi:MAG: peptidoglycan-binding domain-containing protein [Cyclobacteriaceae bacterium]